MRGEHTSTMCRTMTRYGSSPHAWGTLHSKLSALRVHRFIPTCVGNTARPGLCVPLSPVHPHMRGEHAGVPLAELTVVGSSPHAWGTRLQLHRLLMLCRFIPTCVGNTRASGRGSEEDPVHPHMRGEHLRSGHIKARIVGSSPHAWGTLALDGVLHPHERFIPTCVGNTPP